MLVSTPAIVLYYTKYRDSSIIVHLFTESMGRQSLIVYGIKGKKANKLAAFQPLFLIDAVLDFKANRNVQVLKEHKINPPLHNIAGDITKSSIALFIAEVLHRCLNEESSDKSIYSFLDASIKVLNEIEQGVGLFHIAFLIKLSRYLGFSPEESTGFFKYYDLKHGKSAATKPHHDYVLTNHHYKMLIEIYKLGYDKLSAYNISKRDRDILLQAVVQLYEAHAINFNSFKSYGVLKEVFF